MGFTIEDGAGTGVLASVDSLNRLRTLSIVEPEDKSSNKDGRVWSLYFTTTPSAANDYFFYIRNTGVNDLAITDIRVSSTAVTRLEYDAVSGTPVFTSGSDVTPTNRNLGSAKIPTATIKSDVDVTSLTSEGTLFFEEVIATATRYKLTTTSNIILPQGSAVAFKRIAATGEITCLVSLTTINS